MRQRRALDHSSRSGYARRPALPRASQWTMTSSNPPLVLVLIATWNGERWLPEQLESILAQQGVAVRLIASDDQSEDGTPAILDQVSTSDRLSVLPPCAKRFRNANRNFMRLVADAEIENAEFVAFSDQDDIWFPDKLARAAQRITNGGLDAYSSDVVAFWPDGRRRILAKSGTMKAHDHLMESAGPGCTFVLTRERFLELQAWVRKHREQVDAVKVHDWLIYAYGRSRNWRWEIDKQPGLLYRQHGSNEVGANVGWRAACSRIAQVIDGRYIADALTIARILEIYSPMVARIQRLHLGDRIFLSASASSFRRRTAEAWLLAILFLIMRRPNINAEGLPPKGQALDS